MNTTRRKLLLSSLFGAGAIGLKSLATGLPASFFSGFGVKEAHAAEPTKRCASPQFVYFLTSAGGDPLNANVPGTYVDGVYHPTDPQMAPKDMRIGGRTVKAAAPWANLPAEMLARTSFIHHGTYSNSHAEHAKVNRLQGAVARQEMLVSMLAKNLRQCLGTVQAQPIVLSNNLITFNGGVMPVLSPQNLQAVLTAPSGGLLKLQQIRDQHVDSMNALFKESGTPAQREILDRYALSQSEARSLSQQLLNDLAKVKGNSRADLNLAAAVLFKMNVSPVVVASYSFGGDNHGDPGLANETKETVASVAALVDLHEKLKAYQLQDKVTVALQNVFGRTLSTKSHENNADGRNHNGNHHCSVFIGAGFKSSLIGGIRLNDKKTDFQATGFNSASGASDDAGDVKFENTLVAVGTTLARGAGTSVDALASEIAGGIAITTALA